MSNRLCVTYSCGKLLHPGNWKMEMEKRNLENSGYIGDETAVSGEFDIPVVTVNGSGRLLYQSGGFIRGLSASVIAKKAKLLLLLLGFLLLISGLVLYKVIFIATTSVSFSFWILYGIIVSTFLISRIPYAYLYEDRHEVAYADSAYLSVSVVVAAKNEEAGIARTIATCVGSRYPGELECIVVDDGSTDGTKEEARKAQAVYGEQVKLIVFPDNKGKREAMAAGVNEAQGEIVVFVDSDSFLAPDAVRHITEHFLANEKIGAVAGNTKVENASESALAKIQSIQYAVSFDVYKTCESVHRAVTCCPGCFSAYRKRAIQPLIQKWKEQKFLGVKGTFGDDRGLTNFVLRGWDVIYCEKARASTKVPTKFFVYLRQQLRWKKSWVREGILAGLFMWKKHPLASAGFYVHFSFPFLGPVLAGKVLAQSIATYNPFLFVVFMLGFMLIGMVFSLFVRVYRGAEHWMYMPLFSILFVSVLLWQMPYAFLTLRNGHWGTR